MGRSFYSDLTASTAGRNAAEREARIAALLRQQAKDEVVVPEACRGLFSDTSVAVIGGGLGGLSAARELASKGAIVTVFEARGEVGGRVLSNTSFATGRIVEYGAELVGANHPMWLSLARRYGLGLIGRSDAVLHGKAGLQARLELDRLLTLDEQLALAEEMKRRVFVPLGKLASKIIDPAQPWLQPTLKTFDAISVAAFLKSLGIAAGSRLHLSIRQLLVNNNVAPLEQLNLLGLMCLVKGGQFGPQDTQLMGYWEELEIFRAADGCQALARAMAQEFAAAWRGRFKMRSVVTRIDLSKRLDITWNELDKDGRMVKAGQAGFDYVVLAIPPSVWGNVAITPVHPMDPKQVGVMNTGPAVKHFSAMDGRVWMATRSAPLGGALDLGQVWEGSDNQMRGAGQKVVLNVFAGGHIPSAFEPGLERLFGGYGKAGVQTQLMNWPAEPHIRCGYASPAKNQIFSVGQALNKPFARRMVFAGEHTSMAHFGYMEGALQSGRRAARQVVALACSKERDPPAPRTQIARAATEEEVIGSDDRVPVSNAFDIPARWVCAIDIYGRNPADGSEVLADQRATGILIGPCHVLTAAHVFQAASIRVKGETVRVPVLRARVSPGRNGDNDDHPLGWAWSKSIHRLHPLADETDYALVVLDRDLSKATHKKMSGALGYWGQLPSQAALRALDPKTLVDAGVSVIGYPGDRCGSQALTGNAKEKLAKITVCVQRRRDIWASTPWRAGGALFVDPNSAKLEHTADTYDGQSGGPICLRRDRVLELVGVHGGEVPPPGGQPVARNRGARVTPAMLMQLRDWINRAAGRTLAEVRGDTLLFVSARANELNQDQEAAFESESRAHGKALVSALAARIHSGLASCAAALAKVEPQGRRELLGFAISLLQTHFFPKGHGVIGAGGEVLQRSAGALVLMRFPGAEGSPPPFEHRLRLWITARPAPDAELAGRHDEALFSRITLYAQTLRDAGAAVAARVAVHEVLHMMFTFVERLRRDRGDRIADRMLAGEPWRQLDLRRYASQRQALLAPLAELRKSLRLDAGAERLADQLVEEALAYALGQQLDLALQRSASAGQPGPKIHVDAVSVAHMLIRRMLSERHRLPQAALRSASVQAAANALAAGIDGLSAAMREAELRVQPELEAWPA